MVNMEVGVFWKEKINESTWRPFEFWVTDGISSWSAQQEDRNAVQEIRRRSGMKKKLFDSDHHNDKTRNSEKLMWSFQGSMYRRRKFDHFVGLDTCYLLIVSLIYTQDTYVCKRPKFKINLSVCMLVGTCVCATPERPPHSVWWVSLYGVSGLHYIWIGFLHKAEILFLQNPEM